MWHAAAPQLMIREVSYAQPRTLLAKTSYSSTEKRQRLHITQQWLDLVVIDTGVGIAPENLHNVFQPFYTTKAHGIGLGLPITSRLIEDHGGQISIKSQLGYGATVSVRLPMHTDEFGQAREQEDLKSYSVQL